MPQANAAPHDEAFIRALTGSQQALFAYILSLLPNPTEARDVLQDTNVVLWRKAADFRPGSNFNAWACQVARLEVLAHRRDHARDRHVFHDELLDKLAVEAESRAEASDRRTELLEGCLRELTGHQRELIHERFLPGGSVQEMAERRGRTPGSISVTLSRIRTLLRKCVEQRRKQDAVAMSREGRPS